MFGYKEIEKYLSNMFVALIGNNAESLGFSDDKTKRVLVERQNKFPMPEGKTVVQFRLDNFDYWRVQRYGSSSYIDSQGNEHIFELRTCTAIVTVLSKELGGAFNAARLLVANLQNQRYNDYVNSNGRRLGIENISKIKNLSMLENGTWTERIQFEITVNYLDEVVNQDKEMFVYKPEDLSDLDNSVQMTIQTVK